MGLKGTEGNEFASPIESCVITQGCINDPIKPIDKDFNEYLKNQNIHFISHGHIPFCCTVPLIYKNGDIIFISNDTSNGNRPAVYDNLNEIPLSFVSTDKVGICSIDKDENKINYELGKIKSTSNDNTQTDGYYKGFVKIYNHNDILIGVEELNKLFDNHENATKYTAMKPFPTPNGTATEGSATDGGKRRRTRRKNKNKNAKKTNKKGKSKKYRKKGRKTRKIRRRK